MGSVSIVAAPGSSQILYIYIFLNTLFNSRFSEFQTVISLVLCYLQISVGDLSGVSKANVCGILYKVSHRIAHV